MIYKEFKNIYKQVLIILSFLLIIPMIHYSKSSLVISAVRSGSVTHIGYKSGNILYFSIFAFIIIFLSGLLGLTLFSREFKDDSFEYLFSTPLSKAEILLYKIIPRLIVLAFLTLIYIVMFYVYFKELHNFKNSFYILVLPKYLPFWVMLYYFINLCTSVFKQKNWIALMNLLTIYTIFTVPFSIRVLLRKIDPNIGSQIDLLGYSFVIGLLIILLILSTGFMISYKKIDVREKCFAGDSIAKIIIPIEIILITISLLIIF